VHTARQTSANTNSALNSSYMINQSCNVRLIQLKAARKIQFQQFRHKTSSSAFTNRESTYTVSCEKNVAKDTFYPK